MEMHKAHILVVDDDTRLRALLQRFLQENGFRVSAAKGAAEARMMLKQYKFDLLIRRPYRGAGERCRRLSAEAV